MIAHGFVVFLGVEDVVDVAQDLGRGVGGGLFDRVGWGGGLGGLDATLESESQ